MQISTSVLPTLTAVTSIRFVAIRLDRTHARVKQDLQAMEKPAPVSCCGNVKNDFQNDVNVILYLSFRYIRSLWKNVKTKTKQNKKQRKQRKKDGHNTNDISIYTLSDLGDLSNLIGSLSRTIQQYSPPSEWIMCELGVFPILLGNELLRLFLRREKTSKGFQTGFFHLL